MVNFNRCLLTILLTALLPGGILADDPTAIPTFESMGIYWSPDDGAEDNRCLVSYSESGTDEWFDGLPLWFDARDGEYRGSIVNLRPGTSYDFALTLEATGTPGTVTHKTWSDLFHIKQTVALAPLINSTLEITESGDPNDYILYEPEFDSSTIDAENIRDNCIIIDASHIIIRGLTLVNARTHAILLLNGAKDVIIEDCDISEWGRQDWDLWARDLDSAVYSYGAPDIERIVVQRNLIHHPRHDANNWAEPRPAHGNDDHPRGPQAVTLFDSKGRHVIRYNEVTTDSDKYFNDIFGAGDNTGDAGFPNRDSDIYGNHISHCWDDGIESEGANRNVRIWGNYIDWTFIKIASASTLMGPLYIWRNISGVARKDDLVEGDWIEERGSFLKTNDQSGGGRIFAFHNTLLQPDPPPPDTYPLGCSKGFGHGGPMLNVTSRNNILQVHKSWYASIDDQNSDPAGDYDYELYNGDLDGLAKPMLNGIHDYPDYADAGPGNYYLESTSPGFDVGERLPNFNDGYCGDHPDMGAHEDCHRPMEFGVDAYRITLYESSVPTDLVNPLNAVATAPHLPPFHHTPVDASLLFYTVDDRKGNPRWITLDKGGDGLLIYYEY